MKRLIVLAGLVATMASAQAADAPHGPGVIGAPAGTGAWPAVAEGRADAPGYTIYRPARFPDQRLPLVLWGNGGCKNNGLSASHFLREIASHGYFVIANGAPGVESPALDRLPDGPPVAFPPPRPTPDETTAGQLVAAIDWAVRADRAGSFKGRIDTTRIAVMGHSCGGLQAIVAGADPRVKTVMVMNSGVYNRGNTGISGVPVTKDDLRKLHTPVAYILGGPTDIAYPNGTDDVNRIDHVPVFYGNLPTGHGGTYQMVNGGEYARVGVAWLDWQLKGSKRAGAMFAGDPCGLCAGTGWTVVRKQFPEKP
ncbi:hypothetical protein [Novosphingobium sp.]|uniref:hypothetical protein n=1 Tax=Novosphingobium sp. TaxID=1874826 RepID=UPI00352ABE81